MNESLEKQNKTNKLDSLQPDEAIFKANVSRSKTLRCIYIILAWLCIFLGVLGLFIPGLPPFDFAMLAVFFASKGSERLYLWFLNNKYIGPLIKQWKKHRTIPKYLKYVSTISMSIAAVIMYFTMPDSVRWLLYVLYIGMLGAIIWMWSKS